MKVDWEVIVKEHFTVNSALLFVHIARHKLGEHFN